MGSHINRSTQRLEVQQAMDSIRRIVQELRIASRSAERRFGLTAAQLFVLQRLADGESPSVNELAARTLTHQSSVSVVVGRLVERGMIRRERSPNDGRRMVLSLTRRGRDLLKQSPMAAQERLIMALSSLTPPRRRMLARLLDQVARAMGSESQVVPSLFFEEPKRPLRQ